MEIQFQKTVVPYLQTLSHQTQVQEQTQQVRLSEALPDVGRVLASWGQLLLKGKEWRGDSCSISGGVKAWVLYESEDGAQTRCVESWLPFQMKWDIPVTDCDGTVIACPVPPLVDARMLSDRKLMVRANVAVQTCAMVPAEATLYQTEELPQDVQVLKNTYPMLLPAEAGEKVFGMEETISLPSDQQPVEALMRYTLEPVMTESKLVADKLVFRGNARLRILYMGTDGRLHSWCTEFPFSQYAQLDRLYEPGAETTMCFAVTELELETGENGALMLKAGIASQYTVYEQKQITAVEDMYSPNRNIKLMFEHFSVPSMLDARDQMFRAEASAESMPVGIIDAVFLPEIPQVQMGEDRGEAKLSGVFQMLGIDEDGKPHVETKRWENSWTMPVSMDANVRVQILGTDMLQQTGSGVCTELQTRVMTSMQQPMPTVTGAELGEMTEPDPNRPSLILRKKGEESLWELAKQTGSTVEAIQKLNGIQQEPLEDQLLLIPVV